MNVTEADRLTREHVVVPFTVANDLLGFGDTAAYAARSRGDYPVPVVSVGRCLRVPTAPIRALLGLPPI